jgi:hypothetical protein
MLKPKFCFSRALEMTRNTQLTWRLGIASLSLLVAIAVYIFARIYPPEILVPIQTTHSGLAALTGLFGSAPSFFYTLALGLFVGLCASTLRSGRLHCLLWLSLVLLLESTQHPVIASLLNTWLPNILPVSAWGLVGPYWLRGVFDQHDLLASLIGGVVALITLTYFSMERNNDFS